MTADVRRGGAVLGSPIAHSLSPVLHRAAYDALGLADWTYRAVECDANRLADTLRSLEAEGLAGVSLTMPLKRAVLPLLARSDRLVADVGAANTVLFGGVVGEWAGANTDVPGMVAALRSLLLQGSRPATAPSHSPSAAAAPSAEVHRPEPSIGGSDEMRSQLSVPGHVVVLGGGATAGSALAALRDLGIGGAQVFVRRPDAAGDLLGAAGRLGVVVELRPFDDAVPAVASAGLVISTTPVGATDALADALPERLAGTPLLFDVVYSPWPTRLAAAWSAAGGSVIGGLELLVEQAALQVELMTGRTPPVEAMRAAGRAALAG